MKFNTKKSKDYAVLGGGAILGVKGSKVVNEILPSSFKNPVVHGLVSIASVFLAGAISGNGIGSQIGKGSLLGVAINQANVAINSAVSPMLPESDGSKKAMLLEAAFGKTQTGVQGYRGLKSVYSPTVLGALDTEAQQQSIEIHLAE